jgi:hypothetical protein
VPLLNIRTGLGYYNYIYLIIYLRLTKDKPIDTTCWDTGCNTLFINCSWLKKILLGSEIRIIITVLIVKSIESNSYDISEYIILNLRVPGYNQESIESTKVILCYEFYVINKLPANILISIDIMVPQQAKLDLKGTNLILSAIILIIEIPFTIVPRRNPF